MTKRKSFLRKPLLSRKLVVVVISLVCVLCSSLWGHPSTATGILGVQTSGSQNPNLPRSIVDTSQASPVLIADLVNSIIPRARDKVQNTSNIQVAIPIPSRGPATRSLDSVSSDQVVNSQTGNSTTVGTSLGRYSVIANRTPSGRAEPITPPSLDGMFAQEQRGNGRLSRNSSYDPIHGHSHLVADASGRYAQMVDDDVFLDLIAIDNITGDIVELPYVSANSFCGDALNAVINETWTINDTSVDHL
jgi:hypothetical protein